MGKTYPKTSRSWGRSRYSQCRTFHFGRCAPEVALPFMRRVTGGHRTGIPRRIVAHGGCERRAILVNHHVGFAPVPRHIGAAQQPDDVSARLGSARRKALTPAGRCVAETIINRVGLYASQPQRHKIHELESSSAGLCAARPAATMHAGNEGGGRRWFQLPTVLPVVFLHEMAGHAVREGAKVETPGEELPELQ
jgi:hypothetical protein